MSESDKSNYCPCCHSSLDSDVDIRALEVFLKWVESDNKWHMMCADEQRTFIQEFYNCENIQMFFKNLDKTKENKYLISNRGL